MFMVEHSAVGGEKWEGGICDPTPVNEVLGGKIKFQFDMSVNVQYGQTGHFGFNNAPRKTLTDILSDYTHK